MDMSYGDIVTAFLINRPGVATSFEVQLASPSLSCCCRILSSCIRQLVFRNVAS